MPRTKVVRQKPSAQLSPWAKIYIEEIEATRKALKMKLKQKENIQLDFIRSQLQRTIASIPPALANKTISELLEHPADWSGNITSTSVLTLDHTSKHMNITNKSSTVKKGQIKRSSSFGDDEGYRTAEGSSNSTSGGRMSRARSRILKSQRTSRSLSTQKQTITATTTTTTTTTKKINRFRTPTRKVSPSSYGIVTPKVQPNTPQVLLRRPIQGEMALSLQGSPLLTGSVVADSVANVNIPLEDGRLLSIQPKRGLRLSQIPQLDEETRRQLEMLRDNLNKVCASSGTWR